VATAAAVAISIQWFDQPIALMAHHYIRHPRREIFDQLTHISDPLISNSSTRTAADRACSCVSRHNENRGSDQKNLPLDC
jgi:hypothetical protein